MKRLRGRLSAELELQCARCLEPVERNHHVRVTGDGALNERIELGILQCTPPLRQIDC